MSTAAVARPGRPSTGARERILEAGTEVLKADGYAGLTIAKVAARAGENKALIAYHFGSKQGLIAAVGREVGEAITVEVLEEIGDARTVEAVLRGVLDGIWRIMDRDERIARLYFDLSAVSVVEDDVRSVMREVKGRWQEVISDLLRRADDGPGPRGAIVGAVLLQAAAEGFALERVDGGDTADLRQAARIFVRSTAAAISRDA